MKNPMKAVLGVFCIAGFLYVMSTLFMMLKGAQ
jgi:hypothetical protein